MSVAANIQKIKEEIPSYVNLVAVSKTKPIELIQEAYQAGQRIFGENKVQEMASKQLELPNDIEWHMIGHLQTNKVKYIAPFVSLIHSVDSLKLLETINKEAIKNNRIIHCLLQVYIASEETKFGLDELELAEILKVINSELFLNIKIVGLMGMASNTENQEIISKEFKHLKDIYDRHNANSSNQIQFNILSMGMSSDYKIAIKEGSNMIRVGSFIFGNR